MSILTTKLEQNNKKINLNLLIVLIQPTVRSFVGLFGYSLIAHTYWILRQTFIHNREEIVCFHFVWNVIIFRQFSLPRLWFTQKSCHHRCIINGQTHVFTCAVRVHTNIPKHVNTLFTVGNIYGHFYNTVITIQNIYEPKIKVN